MNNTTNKRYYSPQFSEQASVSVRRLAWAIGKPMPAAVDHMVSLIASIVDTKNICFACLDKTRCLSCGFYKPPTPPEQAAQVTGVSL